MRGLSPTWSGSHSFTKHVGAYGPWRPAANTLKHPHHWDLSTIATCAVTLVPATGFPAPSSSTMTPCHFDPPRRSVVAPGGHLLVAEGPKGMVPVRHAVEQEGWSLPKARRNHLIARRPTG